MELSQDFSLAYAFHWDEPIAGTVQEAIASYGSDEDRVQLPQHFSVSAKALKAMVEVPSPEVQLAW